jgi:hypothetical protein
MAARYWQSARVDVRAGAKAVLEDAWDDARGYCWPHAQKYPHLWLWDSCFHAIAWGALGDRRGVLELEAALAGQLGNGFVPHMRYSHPSPGRGPLADRSGYTQPPVHALAAHELHRGGFDVSHLREPVRRAFRYLWEHRRSDGLLVVVHPWETGADDSPRWDSWVGSHDWAREQWSAFDRRCVAATTFGPDGDAVSSTSFTAAPSAFNAITAHGLRLAGRLYDDPELLDWADELGAALDEQLWDDTEQLWSDRAVVGGGDSSALPTLDGVLGALGSLSRLKSLRALDQLRDPARFRAPLGVSFVPRSSPLYRPDQYWRGSAWPQLTYLAVQACRRWGLEDLAAQVAETGRQGIAASGFAEHWDPETGDGLGASPQSWAALAAALT